MTPEMHPQTSEINPALLKECRQSFDWWQKWSGSQAGLWAMFGWAFAEAICWPIIPDFFLVAQVVANRRRFYLNLIAAIAGTAFGGTILVLTATYLPGLATAIVSHAPLVHPQQFEEVRQSLAAEGVGGFLGQPWSGISFKVWAVAADTQGLNPWLVIPTFVAARSLRMTADAVVARLLAGWQARFVRDYWLYAVLIYLVMFFYGWWQVVG